MRRHLLLAAVVLALASPAFGELDDRPRQQQRPGVGLNDPTPVAPVGGNPGTTLGQQRLNVFQRAADLWAAELDSPITITVLASMEPLACTATTATLGSARCAVHLQRLRQRLSVLSRSGVPERLVWIGPGQPARRRGHSEPSFRLPPAEALRTPTSGPAFNSEIGKPGCLTGSFWYYGLDTNRPRGQNNLLVVLLHEIAHGLGFQQFASITTGEQHRGIRRHLRAASPRHDRRADVEPDVERAARGLGHQFRATWCGTEPRWGRICHR
jgi:hypothetical protein